MLVVRELFVSEKGVISVGDSQAAIVWLHRPSSWYNSLTRFTCNSKAGASSWPHEKAVHRFRFCGSKRGTVSRPSTPKPARRSPRQICKSTRRSRKGYLRNRLSRRWRRLTGSRRRSEKKRSQGMAAPGNGSRRYELHASGAIAEAIRRVHNEASLQGRGEIVKRALRRLISRIESDRTKLASRSIACPSCACKS